MAEEARISGDFWFVTFDAHRLRHGFKVTLKSVRVAIRLRTCVAGKIVCVLGFWIQCVTGLAPFVTHEAEVGRVLEDSEWMHIGFEMRRQPVDRDGSARSICSVAFHAQPRRLRVSQLLKSISG